MIGVRPVPLAFMLLGIVTAVPSPAAVNPLRGGADFVEDDLSGSGFEAGDGRVKLPQRRGVMRLRLRSDLNRKALIGLIAELPRVFEDHFPECRGNRPLARLVWPLLRALYERRTLTLDELVAESALAPAEAERYLARLAADGLVRIAAAKEAPLCVFPTDALRRRSNDFADRLNDELNAVLNAS